VVDIVSDVLREVFCQGLDLFGQLFLVLGEGFVHLVALGLQDLREGVQVDGFVRRGRQELAPLCVETDTLDAHCVVVDGY